MAPHLGKMTVAICFHPKSAKAYTHLVDDIVAMARLVPVDKQEERDVLMKHILNNIKRLVKVRAI